MSLVFENIVIGQWVKVIYEDEVFLGKVLETKESHYLVRCLEKPFGINTPQAFERENDAIYYSKVYSATVTPELKSFGRKWMYTYNS